MRSSVRPRTRAAQEPRPLPPGPEERWAEVQRRLRALKKEVLRQARHARKVGARRLQKAHDQAAVHFGRLAFAAARIFLLVTAPFLVLIRGAVWLYRSHGLPTWLALLVSGAATLVLLSVYGVLISRRLSRPARPGWIAKWVAAPLVLCYCGFALLHLARENAKDDAVHSVYAAAHPLLRLAVSTLILADRNAVITDLARTPDDYRRMKLPLNRRSLHYPQEDGWVHAMDLRTSNGLRSLLVEWYFRAMGFDTLRHVGTKDHLHVSLPTPPPSSPPPASAPAPAAPSPAGIPPGPPGGVAWAVHPQP